MVSYIASRTRALGDDEDLPRGRYGRGHTLAFDSGVTVAASASPHVVGKWADAAAVDPEELLVAALASCHMLSFLHMTRDAGLVVTRYNDRAGGAMEAISPGKHAVTRIVLHPEIERNGPVPDSQTLERLHQEAHEVCFIANSVTTTVTVAPTEQTATAGADRQES